MGINFPASPTVGQKYPQPAVAGIPVYTWDGEKWTTVGGSIAAYAPPSTILPLMDATPAVTGVGTAYTREDHVHPTDTTRAALTQVVRYDTAQSLTAPQQQQARQNIYAAPFDAMAYSGLQVNGAMDVSQELASAGTGVSNKYICDGWLFNYSGTMSVTGTQSPSTQFAGLSNLIFLGAVTAQPSLGVSDYVRLVQPIEGYRIARLAWGTANAQPITVSFWSAHVRMGLYSGVITNGAATRSYVFTYTQNASGVSQYNTVTIPGDTVGTWATNNTIGMYLTFTMAAGSTFITPSANTWQGASYLSAPGQVNGVTATSDRLVISGVTVLPGNEAPSAARSPFVMRPYDQELVTCQRYYQKRFQNMLGSSTAAGQYLCTYWAHTVQMRAPPTVGLSGGTQTSVASSVTDNITIDGYRHYLTSTGVGAFAWDNFLAAVDARL